MAKLRKRNFKAYTSMELIWELSKQINDPNYPNEWKREVDEELDRRFAERRKEREESIRAKDALLDLEK